jgi:thiamine-monophosphate kinase
MDLSSIGEFGLIDRLKKRIFRPDRRVVVGIGDDAAVLRQSSEKLLLLTTDVLVERVHFDRRIQSYRQIGWRAMVASVSDVAAMGGEPGHALVSICLPADITVEQTEEVYDGLHSVAEEYGFSIVGGDTVSSPRDLVISVFLTGEVREENLMTRAAAQTEDLICVTGQLGGAQAGLVMLQSLKDKEKTPASAFPENEWQQVRDRHLWPRPRLREAQLLAREAGVHAMIDVSDGLAGEVGHIARQSGVGAEIWEQEIPVGQQTRRLAEHLGISPLDLALHGGEDFELVFTMAADQRRRILQAVTEETGTSIAVVGKVTAAQEGINIVSSQGDRIPLVAEGYRHF